MFVIRFSEFGHLFLHCRWHKVQIALTAFDCSVGSKSHETGHRCFRRHNGSILNNAAVLKRATSALTIPKIISDIELETIFDLKNNRLILPLQHSFQCKRTNQPMRLTQQPPRQWKHDLQCREERRPTYRKLCRMNTTKNNASSWKHNLPRAELFVRRPNDSSFINHAKSSGFYIGQVTSNNSTRLNDYLAVQNDVLGTAKNGVPTNLVSSSLV